MKTSLSPTSIRGLGLALALAWTSAGLAQSETGRPTTSSPDASVFRPATPVSAPAATAQPQSTQTATPKISSAALFPFSVSPTFGPLAVNGIDKEGLPPNAHFSYWTTEVIKLARAGIDDDVLLPFIDSVGMFNLSADEIIYLSDIGVSGQVITTMIQHDFEVAAGLRLVTASASPSSMLFPFTSDHETAANASKHTATAPSVTAPPNASVPASTPAPAMGGDAVIADRGDIISDLAAFDFGMTDQAPPTKVPAPAPARPGPTRTPALYAVRQPYAEAVTPPIIIVPGVDRTPNVVLIRFNP